MARDGFASVVALWAWMRSYGLLETGARLGPDNHEDALLEPHVREFDITGRAMKGWVLVEPEGVEGDDQLAGWIQRAVKFVGTLPAK